MKTEFIIFLVFLFGGLTMISEMNAQCETWTDLRNQDDIISAHSVYRQALRVGDMEIAYENWKIAYENAPAADGQRDFHFTDGITIYKHLIEETDDAELIEEYQQKIIDLYDQAAKCIQAGAIAIRNCDSQACYDRRAGVLLGRLAYDLFYEFNASTEDVYDVATRSMNLAKLESEYTVLIPAAAAVSRMFQGGQIDDERARELHSQIDEILEYNIENNERFVEQFKAVKTSVDRHFARIEVDLYDCDYFKERLLPEFEEAPHDGELARRVFSQLINRGCDEEDPDLQELRERNIAYVDSINAALQLDLEARNPAVAARRYFEEGDYEEAVARFQKAIDMEEDDLRKADFYFRMASIQGRQLNQYSTARRNALRAAELRDNWGAPYMLIGDLYAQTLSNCGGDWNQRLAVLAAIDKYRTAARIDPEVADDANRRARSYYSSKPQQDEGFMRGLSAGDRVTVDCWFNETVTLRFRN